MNRRKVSSFGAKQRLPVFARRLIIVAAAGFGAVACLAFANWIRPAHESEAEVASECDSLREYGEEVPGELVRCELRLVKIRAAQR